jgi:hypothetical protein
MVTRVLGIGAQVALREIESPLTLLLLQAIALNEPRGDHVHTDKVVGFILRQAMR